MEKWKFFHCVKLKKIVQGVPPENTFQKKSSILAQVWLKFFIRSNGVKISTGKKVLVKTCYIAPYWHWDQSFYPIVSQKNLLGISALCLAPVLSFTENITSGEMTKAKVQCLKMRNSKFSGTCNWLTHIFTG